MKTSNIIALLLCICLECLFVYLFSRNKIEHYSTSDKNNKHIVICMSYTDNISSYSKYSHFINKKYAEKHGYDFVKFDYEMTDRAQQWCKVKAINQLLNESEKDYKYIFWIDSDAFFNNFNITLESIIDKYADKDIIICDDLPNSGKINTINTGTMFIKCTTWSKQFCNEWYNYSGEFLYSLLHEQRVLDDYINNNNNNFKDHVAICPTNTFNSASYEYEGGYKNRDDFICHLMARQSDYRINYMKHWIKDHPELYMNIMQTHRYKEKELDHTNYKSAIQSWKSHPNWNWVYYDNGQSYDFILEHLGKKYADAYKNINIGAFKADFFRYCYMYVNGGIYADADTVLLNKDFIMKDNLSEYDIILTRDDPTNKKAFFQGFIYAKPRHILFKKCIDKILQNIQDYKNGHTFEPFHFTGPGLVYECFSELTNFSDELPIGIFNHNNIGNLLILTWNLQNWNIIDSNNTEIFKAKCDGCTGIGNNDYWWHQLGNNWTN